MEGRKIRGLKIIDHPLVQHKLAMLRNKETGHKDFRELANEIAMLMLYEATSDLELKETTVMTPICETKARVLAGEGIAIVPILRAGLGMVDGMLRLIPNAKVGHIGLYRNEKTLESVEYYCKLPTDIAQRSVIVPEPMLATGGSCLHAIALLKKHGAKKIKLMCLVCSNAGLDKIFNEHPDVEIYTVAIDEALDENSYIKPGLGDAGDRLFGTK